MSSLENYYKRIGYRGGTIRESNVQIAREVTRKTFKDDPAYYDITTVNGVYYQGLGCRLFEKNSKTLKRSSKNIQTLIGTKLFMGDIFETKDVVEGVEYKKTWLCTFMEMKDSVLNSGTVEECNYVLKWRCNDEIIEQICVVTRGSKSALGVDTDKNVIQYGDDKVYVQLPFNEHTRKIFTDMRFLIDNRTEKPNAYIVTAVNTLSYIQDDHGVLELTLQACALSKNDNIALMVADYYVSETESEDTGSNEDSEIVEKDQPSILLQADNNTIKFNQVKRIIAEPTNIDEFHPIWNVVSSFDVKIVAMKDNYIDISIPFDSSLVGKTFDVIVNDEYVEVSSTMTIKVRGLI